MDKMPTVIAKKRSKQPKAKKQQPQPHQQLKVVYIANPIKFKATASDFRALVQGLTGQDADVADYARFAAAAEGVGGGDQLEKVAQVAAAEGNVHVVEEEVGQKGWDPSTSMSYDDDGFWHGDGDVHVDVLQTLGSL